MTRGILGAAALVVLVGCGSTQVDGAGRGVDPLAQAGGKVFIVQLAPGADIDATLDDLSRGLGAPVTQRYRAALRGGALLVPSQQALNQLGADPRVVQLDEDQLLEAIAGKPPKPITDGGTGGTDAGTDAGAPQTQTAPTGYRLIGADQTPNEGAGVRVAVIDTGADLTHPDLAASLEPALGKDCINESGGALVDQNGHGTHVAGTIAALNNSQGSVGIGTGIKVVPVKVLNRRGSGTWSQVICGIDHVTANAAAIKVANMSLGGNGSECTSTDGGCTKSALQVAIENSLAAGVTYAVAAGNEGVNAATKVPSAYSGVITVSAYRDSDGALSSDDGWPSFTNFGDVVDIAAPGVNIYSTWKAGGYNTISGTSMASPHVAAAAALYLSTHPGATAQEVRDRLRANATASYPCSTDPKHAEPLLNVRGLLLCTQSCDSLGFNCGSTSDGCGGVMTCGSAGGACASPSVCTSNVCVCTPTVTCATQGATCGAVTDDCGNVLDCGGCGAPAVCENNACVCTPTVTCETYGATCGTVTDDCGNELSCGTCPEGQSCTLNVCG